MVTAFEELSADEDIPEEFMSYFELTYIGVMRGRGNNRRRSTPLFPIPMWNVHSRVEHCMPRTNNSIEGFNNAFFQNIAQCHPNIWKCISFLKKEEILGHTKILQFERGDEIHKQRKYKDVIDKLKRTVDLYSADHKISFLRSVAYNLHSF